MPFGKLEIEHIPSDEECEMTYNHNSDMIFDEVPDKQYAFTFNICQYERINNKRWGAYDEGTQINILTRKMRAYIRNFPNLFLNWEEVFFEKCPKGKQMHMHGRLKGNPFLESTDVIEACEGHINGAHKTKDYKTMIMKPIYNSEGWDEYIRKDQPKKE